MSQVHVLNQMTLGIPSANKYSPWLRKHLSMVKEMAEYSEDVEPITGKMYGPAIVEVPERSALFIRLRSPLEAPGAHSFSDQGDFTGVYRGGFY